MDIQEIIRSTVKVGQSLKAFRNKGENRYSPEYTFTKKQLGSVYLSNMVANYKTEEKIVEIVLLMSPVTEAQRACHRIAIALKGIFFEEFNIGNLCEAIRKENSFYEDVANEDIIKMILENDLQPFDGKTIIQKSTTERKFIVIDNSIPSKGIDIMTRCSCSNYLHMWSWYNADYGCLIGKRPPPYKRKTYNDDGSFETVRNPKRLPGICKHTMLLLALLMNQGLVKKLPSLVNYAPTLSIKKGRKQIFTVPRADVERLLKDLKEQLVSEGAVRRGFNY